ncbi:MAG TPA: efflux RND transporter periplasmic adaptor subunit [Halanaerobiales bacterium]|nr:efflux RND transporter periplasmic adaptor subunit [Halanaerobiales bacterium]
MKKKILIFVFILIIIAGGVWFVRGRMGAESADKAAVAVDVIEASPGNITTTVSADGNIRAADTKEVKTKVSSFIEEIYVESGDLVKENEKIARVEDYDFKNNLEELEFKSQEANINYKQLHEKYTKQDELNKLRIDEAEKNLEIAISSKEKEKINLNNQKQQILKRIDENKESLKNAKQKLEDNKYLYNKGAITKNNLEEIQNSYDKQLKNINNLEKELKILNEKTIPNSLELADLQIENAKNNLRLLKYNIEEEKIDEEDLKLAEIEIKRLENSIAKAKKDLENVIIKTPYEGTIIESKFSEGSRINQGDIIVTLANINDLEAEIFVDEIDVNQVKIGQKVILTSDSFPKKIEGKVDFVAPISTKVGNINKYKTEIKLNKPAKFLKVGMFLNAEITTNHKENVITIPSMSILGEEEKYVFIYENNKAIKRIVEIGLQSISEVEVKGVKEGEKIISGPFNIIRNLEDGAEVSSR